MDHVEDRISGPEVEKLDHLIKGYDNFKKHTKGICKNFGKEPNLWIVGISYGKYSSA